MTKKNIRTACKWTVTACAVAVAILSAMDGNLIGVIWPLIAATTNWTAISFEELTGEIMDDYEKLMLEAADVIEKQEAEIAALKEEINRLKCR